MADGIVRLSVNLNAETADLLKRIAADRGMSLTEVIRRSIAVYAFAEDERRAGNRIVVGDGRECRELVIL